MCPLCFSTAVFIFRSSDYSLAWLFSRKHCFSRVYFSSRLFFSSWCLIMVYRIKTLTRWKKKSRSLCWLRSLFENNDSSEDPFLWATKENPKATGKCHLFTFFSITTLLYALFVWWAGNTIQEVHKAEVTQTRKVPRQNLNWTVQSVSIAKCFLFKSFLTRWWYC